MSCEDLFGFILFWCLCGYLGYHWRKTWISVSTTRLGKFSTVIYSKRTFHSFLSSPSGTPKMQMLLCLIVPEILYKVIIFFVCFLFPLALWLGNFHQRVFQIADLVLCIIKSVDDSTQCIFSFLLLHSSTTIDSLLYILSLCEFLTVLLHYSVEFGDPVYEQCIR